MGIIIILQLEKQRQACGVLGKAGPVSAFRLVSSSQSAQFVMDFHCVTPLLRLLFLVSLFYHMQKAEMRKLNISKYMQQKGHGDLNIKEMCILKYTDYISNV